MNDGQDSDENPYPGEPQDWDRKLFARGKRPEADLGEVKFENLNWVNV